MFLSRNKKNNVYPCKPQFYCMKGGFKGGQNYIGMFRDVCSIIISQKKLRAKKYSFLSWNVEVYTLRVYILNVQGTWKEPSTEHPYNF